MKSSAIPRHGVCGPDVKHACRIEARLRQRWPSEEDPALETASFPSASWLLDFNPPPGRHLREARRHSATRASVERHLWRMSRTRTQWSARYASTYIAGRVHSTGRDVWGVGRPTPSCTTSPMAHYRVAHANKDYRKRVLRRRRVDIQGTEGPLRRATLLLPQQYDCRTEHRPAGHLSS